MGEPVASDGAARPDDWLTRGVLGLLHLYKVTFSRLFTGSCRFMPSCSEYAADAICAHGLVKGAGLAAWRLGRCHPFATAGYDPVPAARRAPPPPV